MKRPLPHAFGILLVVGPLLILSSCGTRERQTVIGLQERVARPAINAYESEPAVGGRAVVVLAMPEKEFYEAHPDLSEIATITYGAETYRLVWDKDTLEGLVERLQNLPGVKAAFPDHEVWAADGQGEAMGFDDGQGDWLAAENYRNQRVLELIRWKSAWEATNEKGGSGVDIAILDTGIDPSHPEWKLAPIATIIGMQNYSFLESVQGVTETSNKLDDDGDGRVDEGFGHGTHVAGIAHLAAPAAHLLVYKVLNDDGRGTVFGVALAIQHAVAHGAEVINLSLGLTAEDPLMQLAVQDAAERGVAVVASAGNRHVEEPQFPAAYDEVIAVTSITDDETLADFANFGSYVDLSAPGVGIVSTYPHWGANPYASCSGGSMAVPFVAGSIALRMAAAGVATGRQAGQDIWWTATNIDGKNDSYKQLMGRGRIDLLTAIILK